MSYNVYRFLLLPFFQLLLCFCVAAEKKKKNTNIQFNTFEIEVSTKQILLDANKKQSTTAATNFERTSTNFSILGAVLDITFS